MTDDIVTRLRGAASESYGCQCVKCEAADEIERLRREINALCETLRTMNDLVTQLRAERDEARRRLCLEWMEHGPVRLSKEQIAMRYGWDCFKETTKGKPPIA